MAKKTSLAIQIKKVIGNRILFCCVIFMIIIFALTIYDLSISINQLRARITEKLKPIEDFAINQAIINNIDTVELKIESFNENNSSFKIEWIRQGIPLYKTITWQFPFSWILDYEIGKIGDYQFGYFKISGSFLSDKTLIYDLFFRLTLFGIITISVLSILYPLAKKIPEQLFLTPINRVIDLISNNALPIDALNKTLPIELEILETKILALLKTATEHERNKAAIELGHLSAQLAHDIRSPLAAMEIGLQQLSAVPQRELTVLSNGIQSVRDIANDLLDRYRNPITKYSSASLNSHPYDGNVVQSILLFPLIKLMISQKKYEWQKYPCELILTTDNDSKFCWINVSSNEVKRVLSNLLNNAYDALFEKKQGIIYLKLKKSNTTVTLQIEDNGIGIPEEKITDVLNGTSLKHHGKGLGLSGAKKYMENLNGKLTINSKTGEGTKIYLTFPLTDNVLEFPKEILLKNMKTVVVLDDDFSILTYWQQRISGLDISLKLFSTYEKALQWLQDNTEIVQSTIFIIDYELGQAEKNGLVFLKNIKSTAHCYLVTSHAEDIGFQKLMKKEGVQLIPKSLIDEVTLNINRV